MLGDICQQENLLAGVEVGVQGGVFAKEMLTRWKSCKSYLLVDLWAKQENYQDLANADNARQELIMQDAMRNVSPWQSIIKVCRNYSTACAHHIPAASLDFVYIDARHDYKGVLQDLRSYWPKLRVGGILAGHDYVAQDDGPAQSGQNWTVNYDGTVDPSGRAAKGAVDDFAARMHRQVVVSYREAGWNSYAIRK